MCEREYVRVCDMERETLTVCVCVCVYVCVIVRVCEREREKERKSQRESQREREYARERTCECVSVRTCILRIHINMYTHTIERKCIFKVVLFVCIRGPMPLSLSLPPDLLCFFTGKKNHCRPFPHRRQDFRK